MPQVQNTVPLRFGRLGQLRLGRRGTMGLHGRVRGCPVAEHGDTAQSFTMSALAGRDLTGRLALCGRGPAEPECKNGLLINTGSHGDTGP